MKNLIKVSHTFLGIDFIRQTPKCEGKYGGSQFIVNDLSYKECDYWIVYHDILDDELEECKTKGTILFTAEPESVYKYPQKFLEQFDIVVTSQKNLICKNKVYSHTSLPWHIGRVIKSKDEIYHTRNYTELSNEKIVKTKLISVITSNKTFTQGHRQRLDFVYKLKEHFGERLDVFGRGINEFEDKWDTIAPYKYHIVLENISEEHYWTEKLADSFLGESYPIYYGCSNIGDCFSKNSFSTININNIEESIATIEKIIDDNQYEKSINEIKKSKQLVLNKYNFFSYVLEIIDNNHLSTNFQSRKILTHKQCLSLYERMIQVLLIIKRKLELFYFKLKGSF